MKKLGNLLKKNILAKEAKLTAIDEKSLFFIFQGIISEEFGKQGLKQIKSQFFKDRKLFIKAGNPNWANEIWLNKDYLVRKTNKEIGWEEIVEIVISQ